MKRLLSVFALTLLTACGGKAAEPSLPPIDPLTLSLPGRVVSPPPSGWQLVATVRTEWPVTVGVGQADDNGDFTLQMDEAALQQAARPYQRRPDFGTCTWSGEEDTGRMLVTGGVNLQATRPDGTQWDGPLLPRARHNDYGWELLYVTGQGKVTTVQTCRSSSNTFDSVATIRTAVTFTPGWNLLEHYSPRTTVTSPGGRELQSSELWIRKIALPGRFLTLNPGVLSGY